MNNTDVCFCFVFFLTLLVNMIVDETLYTILTQYTISPTPPPYLSLSFAPPFLSLPPCTFDSGPRTGSSPQG